jgi:hypothetical protein
MAPLGPWRTHLIAQTVNDVPAGMDPDAAAQSIGGIPVTRNFEFVGEGRLTPGGAEGCMFRPSLTETTVWCRESGGHEAVARMPGFSSRPPGGAAL